MKIIREVMDEELSDSIYDKLEDFELQYIIDTVKVYTEQMIELAADTAEAFMGIGCDGEDIPIVSKGSILKIKEQIK